MGERRRKRAVDPDERLHGEPGSGHGTAVTKEGGGANLSDHVLGLQRDYGNAAVTTVVQRAPRDRPASTDIKDVIKSNKAAGKGKKAPPAPVIEDFRPKQSNPNYPPPDKGIWSTEKIKGWIGDHGETATGGIAKQMADLWDELYWRNPDWRMALNISRAWKKAGDNQRAAFWMRFFNNRGELKAPE